MNVQLVKIITGEEILCDLEIDESPEGTSYIMKHPTILIPQGNSSMAMLPYMPMAEFENKTLTLPERNVIAFAKAIKQVKEQFEQSITGIVAPPEKELITPGLKLT